MTSNTTVPEAALANTPGPVLTALLGGVVCCLTFGLGATLSLSLARRAVKRPLPPLLGVCTQYLCMPLVAFALAKAFRFGPFKAIGLLLTGASPGGSTSNLLCHLTGADLPLSITMTVLSTLVALGMVPLILFVYAPPIFSGSETPDFVIPYWRITLSLLFVLFPTLGGIYLRHRSPAKAKIAEKVGTSVGVAFLFVALAVGIADNIDVVNQTPATYIAGIVQMASGFGIGYVAAWGFKLSPRERLTVSFEVGVQNTIISISIVALSFGDLPTAQLNEALVFPLMCSLWDVVNTLLLLAGIRWGCGTPQPPAAEEVFTDDDADEGEDVELQSPDSQAPLVPASPGHQHTT